MRTITVDETPVEVREIDGKWVWGCILEYFRQQNQNTTGSYCPHGAGAILQRIRVGSIDSTDGIVPAGALRDRIQG